MTSPQQRREGESGNCENVSALSSCTVNKLRSLNLHFSSMFCIESKVVPVGTEKIITLHLYQVFVKLEDFSFTFNDAALRQFCLTAGA